MDPAEAKDAISYLQRIFNGLSVIPTQELAEQTITIAQTEKIPIYDAVYIALAQKTNSTLFTADRKLHQTAKTIATSKLLQE